MRLQVGDFPLEIGVLQLPDQLPGDDDAPPPARTSGLAMALDAVTEAAENAKQTPPRDFDLALRAGLSTLLRTAADRIDSCVLPPP